MGGRKGNGKKSVGKRKREKGAGRQEKENRSVILNFLPDAGGVSVSPPNMGCRNKFGMTGKGALC